MVIQLNNCDRMKVTFVILAIASAVAVVQSQSAVQWAGVYAIRTACLGYSMVNPLYVLKVRAGDFSIVDPKLQKYTFCVYKLLKIATEDGEMDKAAGLKIIPPQTDPAKFSAAIDACRGRTGATKEEKFWNAIVCYNNQYPGDIFAL